MSNCPSYFHILQYVQVSSGLNYYFLSYRVRRHTQTDRHEYSIVAADKRKYNYSLTASVAVNVVLLKTRQSSSNSVASPGIV